MTRMESTYRSAADQRTIQDWCLQRLAGWRLDHERRILSTTAGDTHVTMTGGGPPTVVLVPGTSANAVLYQPLVEVLSARWPTMIVDIPGQPGLSAAQRPRRNRLSWYGAWLGEVLDQTGTAKVIIVGHSLGGAVALACGHPRIGARVLVGTAGLARLQVQARTLAATLPWMARPTEARSAALVRRFLAPNTVPSELLVEWYTLVARHCRTSLAPPVLPSQVLASTRAAHRIVATGRYDTFVPPHRLLRATRNLLGTDVRVIPDAGHFVTDESPSAVLALVDEASRRCPGGDENRDDRRTGE